MGWIRARLTWSPPKEPVRNKLDSWYFRSTRKVDSRASVPFFPRRTRAAGENVHSTTQAIFSHVDGGKAHGYVRSPPVKETVAAHLCPAAAKTLGSDISLPSKPCKTTAHLANKAYAFDGEVASALPAMALLQVFQAKLLQAAEGGTLTVEAVKDLRAATDFTLMATKRAAQAMGKAMGFMIVLQRHLWLNLADLKDADRKVLLKAPVTPSGLFGDAVESITERMTLARRWLLSRCPDGLNRGGECERGPAPKRQKFTFKCEVHIFKCQMHTFSQIRALSSSLSKYGAACPTSEQCTAVQVIAAHPTTKPLCQFISAWEVIPGISPWLLSVIERGYTLIFRCRPPRFNGVVQSLTLPQCPGSETRDMLSARERSSRASPTKRVVPTNFVVPKRAGGLRPILDLRPINRALCKRPFRMITLKQILAQIRLGTGLRSWI